MSDRHFFFSDGGPHTELVCVCIFSFKKNVIREEKSLEQEKKRVLAAILWGNTKRLSMKQEGAPKQQKKITKQTNTYSKKKSKKDWPLPPSVVEGAQRLFKDEWRPVSKRIMTGNKV